MSQSKKKDIKPRDKQQSRTQLLATTIAVFGISMGVNMDEVVADSSKKTEVMTKDRPALSGEKFKVPEPGKQTKQAIKINSRPDIMGMKMKEGEELMQPDSTQ